MESSTYLPLGSVVMIGDSAKRVMICGRRIASESEGTEYDYQGCLYPEGAVGNQNVLLFNRADISMIYFIGFQDIEELAFRQVVLKNEEADKE